MIYDRIGREEKHLMHHEECSCTRKSYLLLNENNPASSCCGSSSSSSPSSFINNSELISTTNDSFIECCNCMEESFKQKLRLEKIENDIELFAKALWNMAADSDNTVHFMTIEEDSNEVWNVPRYVHRMELSKYIGGIVDYVARHEKRKLEECFDEANTKLTIIVSAIVVMNRFLTKNTTFVLTRNNIQALVFSCIVLATKGWKDQPIANSRFAPIGGLQLLQLNNLERMICQTIEHEIIPSCEEFVTVRRMIFQDA